MKILAVVVTYNRRDLLERGIGCLRRQKQLDGIVVVDNGSTDGTAAWLDSQPSLTVIHQDNVGGSGGFHTGIQRAYDMGADWIWCMDDDVFPREDCLDRLLEQSGRPNVGLLMPRRLSDGKVFTHEFQHFNFTGTLSSVHGQKLSKQTVTDVTPIVGADFEGPFISRRAVEAVGLPNKELFIFCDDTDYCLRIHQAGFKLYYVPQALMDKHVFFASDSWAERNRKKKWKRYYQVRNEAYLNHHYGRNWGVRYVRSFIGVVGYVVPAVLSMPFSKAWQWKDIAMLWRAYQDGAHERLGKR